MTIISYKSTKAKSFLNGFVALLLAASFAGVTSCGSKPQPPHAVCHRDSLIKFIYCSDLHYGISRDFRGKDRQASYVVREMIRSFELLTETTLPEDGGIGGGTVFGCPDFVVCTGDIANRMQKDAWSATRSWKWFEKDMIEGFATRHDSCPVYLVPGNHDISNAIGHPKLQEARKDDASAVGIYNQNMVSYSHPPIQNMDYNSYLTDKVHYTFVLDNLRFAFMGMWPDKDMRNWMDSIFEKDSTTSTIIFTHDPLEADAKHFTNPNPPYNINEEHKFENLLADTCSVKYTAMEPKGNWHELEMWFQEHPQIKAYFHGDCNYNEFYEWHGTDGNIDLPAFRVDSPMKGEYSSDMETLLSYQVVCIDTRKRMITVRECLWNKNLKTGIDWGESKTISY